jgi:DNA-binding MarR family transcriptional regulator
MNKTATLGSKLSATADRMRPVSYAEPALIEFPADTTQDGSSMGTGHRPGKTTIAEVGGILIHGISQRTGIATMESQQILLLLALYQLGEVEQSRLNVLTGVGKSSNGRHIKRLGKGTWVAAPGTKAGKKFVPGLNWIESWEDPLDQRAKRVRLTAYGRQQIDEVIESIQGIL